MCIPVFIAAQLTGVASWKQSNLLTDLSDLTVCMRTQGSFTADLKGVLKVYVLYLMHALSLGACI